MWTIVVMRTQRLRNDYPETFVGIWGGRAIQLRKGELWHLEDDLRGLSIACMEGILWITQEGDPKDYVIEPGQRYVIARRGSVVIEACADARLRVAPPLEIVPSRTDLSAAPRA
jgi:hypothetical protein